MKLVSSGAIRSLNNGPKTGVDTEGSNIRFIVGRAIRARALVLSDDTPAVGVVFDANRSVHKQVIVGFSPS